MGKNVFVLIVTVGLLAGACGGDGTEGSPPASDAPDDSAEDQAPTDPALLLPADFEQVCGGGTVSGAAPYDESPGLHPVLAFEGEDPEYEYSALTLPEGWQSDSVSVADTQLVACLDRIKEERVLVCEDYESDDFPEPFDVEVYSATWDVTLYEANTGEEVASGKISATEKECPFIVFYDEGEEVQREYADQSDQFRGFVKEYVSR